MAKHIVTCRTCGEKFDAQPDGEGTVWIMPSRNFYYHKQCYGEWKVSDNLKTDDEWIPRIYDFIARDLKVSYDYHLCEGQRKKFIKEKRFTNKGIYFALRYHYEVNQQTWSNEKAKGGIGIVPYVYSKSVEYWVERERQQKGILSAIEQQLRDREEKMTVITVKKTKKETKRKPKWRLEDVEAWDD